MAVSRFRRFQDPNLINTFVPQSPAALPFNELFAAQKQFNENIDRGLATEQQFQDFVNSVEAKEADRDAKQQILNPYLEELNQVADQYSGRYDSREFQSKVRNLTNRLRNDQNISVLAREKAKADRYMESRARQMEQFGRAYEPDRRIIDESSFIDQDGNLVARDTSDWAIGAERYLDARPKFESYFNNMKAKLNSYNIGGPEDKNSIIQAVGRDFLKQGRVTSKTLKLLGNNGDLVKELEDIYSSAMNSAEGAQLAQRSMDEYYSQNGINKFNPSPEEAKKAQEYANRKVMDEVNAAAREYEQNDYSSDIRFSSLGDSKSKTDSSITRSSIPSAPFKRESQGKELVVNPWWKKMIHATNKALVKGSSQYNPKSNQIDLGEIKDTQVNLRDYFGEKENNKLKYPGLENVVNDYARKFGYDDLTGDDRAKANKEIEKRYNSMLKAHEIGQHTIIDYPDDVNREDAKRQIINQAGNLNFIRLSNTENPKPLPYNEVLEKLKDDNNLDNIGEAEKLLRDNMNLEGVVTTVSGDGGTRVSIGGQQYLLKGNTGGEFLAGASNELADMNKWALDISSVLSNVDKFEGQAQLPSQLTTLPNGQSLPIIMKAKEIPDWDSNGNYKSKTEVYLEYNGQPIPEEYQQALPIGKYIDNNDLEKTLYNMRFLAARGQLTGKK